MTTKIFVNLPVESLEKSKEFFIKLGYKFNKQFTDENAACLVISEDIYAMLIAKGYFTRFTKKAIAEPKKVTESIIALSAASRREVDQMIERAVMAGGREYGEKEDMEWMYGRNFEDLDGHQWGYFWMDENKIEKS